MATAPTPGGPGTTADLEAVEAAQRVLHITLRGERLSFCPDNLDFHVKARIRRGTGGNTFGSYWSGETSIAEDSLQVMWWTARMVNGEPTLTIDQVLREWPKPLRIEDWDVSLEGPGVPGPDPPADAIDVDEVETDPEDSGPSS